MPEIFLSWPQPHHIYIYHISPGPTRISLQWLYMTIGHIVVFKRPHKT